MWQKRGVGTKYKATYKRDDNDERIIVLTGVKRSGKVHVVTAESWQMLKAQNWVKCK